MPFMARRLAFFTITGFCFNGKAAEIALFVFHQMTKGASPLFLFISGMPYDGGTKTLRQIS